MQFNSLRRCISLFSFVCGLLCALTSTAQSPAKSTRSAQLESAVVKIFTTSRAPDSFRPWQKAAPSESTGSGVVIEGNRILTNAHVVNYASKVEVRAKEGGDKIAARVIAIASGIDLAVRALPRCSGKRGNSVVRAQIRLRVHGPRDARHAGRRHH